jgi:dephospho-CoA kinase
VIFGLTGGIACGKSTVAAFMTTEGVAVVDADRVAREVVRPGTEGLRRIAEVFGAGVLARDGTLDRKALGERVFADGEARALLNGITHPLIRAASMQRAAELAATGYDLIAYEAALLIEAGNVFRPLVVVIADDAVQVERLMLRDGISVEQARARVAAQMPVREKAAMADHVIDTTGTLEQVRARTAEVVRAIEQSRDREGR